MRVSRDLLASLRARGYTGLGHQWGGQSQAEVLLSSGGRGWKATRCWGG